MRKTLATNRLSAFDTGLPVLVQLLGPDLDDAGPPRPAVRFVTYSAGGEALHEFVVDREALRLAIADDQPAPKPIGI